MGWPMYVKDKFIQPKLPHSRRNYTSMQTKRRQTFNKLIRQRDNYTCQLCGSKERELTVHHIDGYRHNPEWRLYLNNAVTICKRCHSCYNQWSENVNTSEKWFMFLEGFNKIFNDYCNSK